MATVLDVGANRGQFAIYSCNRFPVAALHCFEPIPEARAKLEEVVPSNRNITVHNVALASVRGSVDFHVSVDDDSSSLLPASRDQIAMFPGSRRDRTISVRTERLDDVLADQELARPVLMKLDIQGAELEALKGAAETLAKTEYVLVECSFVELYDGQAFGDEVISFLRNVGFDLVGLYSPTIVDGLLLQADAFFTRRV
ncbi:MAG: FkbM family methyltransferase [Actinobacteria bacterium]|nr:FkbM family methyltransferase [Actinomycetota bacterium]